MSPPREHRIRLQQAWTLTRVRDAQGNRIDSIEAVRAAIGESWQSVFAGFIGTMRYERVFHPPQNLTPDEKVAIHFESITGCATVWVNGERVLERQSSVRSLQVDVTELLKPIRNLWLR